MKLFKYIALAVIPFIAAGCDNISKDDRYIEVPPIEVKRAVLIEEFTGQLCVNCPDGHRIISSLVEKYGEEAVIPVCIHAGTMSIQEVNSLGVVGLGTADGNKYFEAAGSPALPAAWFNRMGKPSINRADWATQIESYLKEESKLDILLDATLKTDVDGKQSISISTELRPQNDMSGNLQLWVVENGIKTFQLDGSKVSTDYEENHVFRATVNGLDGTPVSLTNNVYDTSEFSIDVASTWRPENIVIVGFVYNDSGVLQAAQTKVKVESAQE